MRSFWSLKEQGMWMHFSRRIVHADLQWMSSWTVCMMCLVAVSCWINFQSTLGVGGSGHHVHQTWIPVFISFGFTSESCVVHQSTHSSEVASRNWNCCWRDHRWHVAWHSWQLCGLFTVSSWGWTFSYWTCVHMTSCTQTLHESELSFNYDMLLYHKRLHMYCTSKLLQVFLHILYKKVSFHVIISSVTIDQDTVRIVLWFSIKS